MEHGPRISREKKTVACMMQLYCSGHGHEHPHDGVALCPDCSLLQEYAFKRLDLCRFGEQKTTCANCPVHCYAKPERARMRAVMRYSGPRMLARHPILAVRHLIDGRKKDH